MIKMKQPFYISRAILSEIVYFFSSFTARTNLPFFSICAT